MRCGNSAVAKAIVTEGPLLEDERIAECAAGIARIALRDHRFEFDNRDTGPAQRLLLHILVLHQADRAGGRHDFVPDALQLRKVRCGHKLVLQRNHIHILREVTQRGEIAPVSLTILTDRVPRR